MKSNRQQTSKPGSERPSPAKERPATARPNPDRFGATVTAMLIRAVHRASTDEIVFLEKMLIDWNEGVYTLPEIAFVRGNAALGFPWLMDPENDPKLSEDLRATQDILRDPNSENLATALRGMLDSYRSGGSDMTVEDALWYFEDRLRQEQEETDAARRLLKTRPGVLRHEIREAVRKDRHLLEEVPNAE